MSTATEDKELLAGLTEEERAILAEGDDTDTEEGEGDGENDAGGDGEDGATGADDDAGAGDDNDADAAEGRDDGATDDAQADEPKAETKQAAAPLLVAEAPADAEEKLKEIADQKADLRKKYDDGDLTFEEYETQKETLDEQRLEIKMAVKEAETATKMVQQQARTAFLTYAEKFTSEIHPEYAKDQALYEALDKQVIELANLPKFANLTGEQILEKAHRLILLDHQEVFAERKKEPEADKGASKKQVTPKPNLPPNLAKVPAAAMNDTGEGRFATLDRLAERGGMEFEKALAKLSDAERDAYLSS